MNSLSLLKPSLILLAVLAINACQGTPASPTPAPTLQPRATASAPTATTQPLAAVVNGEGIPLSAYQAELSRYQQAVGTELATEQKQIVLDTLIDRQLLAQAAAEDGFIVDEAMVNERLNKLMEQIGGETALQSWMDQNSFTIETLKEALRLEIAAAWMRDQIYNQTPKAMEQVHARQILLYTAEKADQVLAELKNGGDFAKLAALYDPVTYGDLGWFPRGFLLDPKLEEAIFSLAPNEITPVIQTSAGYHIVQLLAREAQRPLDADTYQAIQLLALQTWLQQRRAESAMEITLP
ncbi:MAG: peptidylprolyl isomerase [Chloroflexota bacterium]